MTDDITETMADISSLCSKVAHDFDRGEVLATDLIELRDAINLVRRHVSLKGYKTVPMLVRGDT